VRQGGSTLLDRVVVGAGGGGDGVYPPDDPESVPGSGGPGGALEGTAGGDGDGKLTPPHPPGRWPGGGGGTQTAGGIGLHYASSGIWAVGGTAGYLGGAGGGGWYGGGGGAGDIYNGSSGGGGGGSSYITTSAFASSLYGGKHLGNGLVFIQAGINKNLADEVSAIEKLGYNNPAELTCKCARGEPVDTSTGNFWHTFNDFSLPSNLGMPLDVSHTYNSLAAGTDGPLGFGWSDSLHVSLSVDSLGIVTVRQENGSEVSFTPTADGFSAPSRVLATLVKNPDKSYSFTRNATDHFDFDGISRLVRQYGLTGNPATGYGIMQYSYDAAGRLAKITNPVGRWIAVGYEPDRRHIHLLTDSMGRNLTFNHDSHGNLVSFIAVDGARTTFTYDGAHRMLTMLDPQQQDAAAKVPLTNHYDAKGRVDWQTDQLGRTTAFIYNNESTTVIDPAGHATIDSYVNGLLAATTSGFGTSEITTKLYNYDPLTNALIGTRISAPGDPNDHSITTEYDARGNPTKQIDGLGRETIIVYNDLNVPTSVTSPNPSSIGPSTITTRYTYDAWGGLVSVTAPLYTSPTAYTDQVTSYQRDPARPDLVTSMTDPRGHVTRYAYDAKGQLMMVTTPESRKSTFTYDALGRIRTSVAPQGNVPGTEPSRFTTTFTYDAAGRLLSTRVANGSTPIITSRAYDRNGQVVKDTDAARRTTTYIYDKAGQLTSVRRADGTQLRTTYFADGVVQSEINAAGQATTYTEDPFGRVATIKDSLGHATTYSYDGAGNIVKVRDAQGQTTSIRYDNSDQWTSRTYSDGRTPSVSVAYNAAGLRTSMQDGTGTSTWTYDSLGRLTSQVTPNGMVSYSYDAADHLTALTYPGGQTVTRSYGDDGELTSVTDWLSKTTTFAYDANGVVRSVAAANGVTTANVYDDASRLSGISFSRGAARFAGLSYIRNAAGEVRTETSTGIGARQTYTYNSLGQVVTNGTASISYDKADNLTRMGDGSRLTYDAAGRVKILTKPASAVTNYTYDAPGNRISASGGTSAAYSYDQDNRLTQYISGATTVLYTYNGDGLRQSKAVGPTTEQFVYDTSEDLPLILSDGTYSYIYANADTPLEQIDGAGNVTYLHTDHLGSVRLLTDSAGAQVGTANYDPYGTSTKVGVLSAFGYAGQYTDSESGLVWMRTRYYDPRTGQFITRDPAVTISRAPYAYAKGDPINMRDPRGLWPGEKYAGLGLALASVFSSRVRLAEKIVFASKPLLTFRRSTAGFRIAATRSGTLVSVYRISSTRSISTPSVTVERGLKLIETYLLMNEVHEAAECQDNFDGNCLRKNVGAFSSAYAYFAFKPYQSVLYESLKLLVLEGERPCP
jgi:RHS repeat-associated protein